jgi:hypothetical protein
MANIRCTCPGCTVGSLTWPILFIVAGVLFLVGQFSYRYSFGDLWPILIIALGLLKLLENLAPRTGHLSGSSEGERK